MEGHHACLQFSDKTFGILRDLSLELAADIYQRYQDHDCARKEGIAHCWVLSANDFQLVLGNIPVEWSPGSPMREKKS
jgi:hypothetical protein